MLGNRSARKTLQQCRLTLRRVVTTNEMFSCWIPLLFDQTA